MPIRKSTIWLGSALILAGLLAQPAGVAAQCATASIQTNTYTLGGMGVIAVEKVLSGTYQCTRTMSMGLIDCAPDSLGDSTSVLSATAFTTVASPTCGWACACGAVTITGADGLPVELMEFSVEDAAADGSADESNENTEDDEAG